MSNIFISLGLCLLFTDAASSCCSDGWIRFGASCYFFGHDDRTFQEAQHFCEHYKANLVNIESSLENTFLKSFASGLQVANHWIGLTDETIEDIWKLYPSEATASFLDWQSTQPNEGKSSNCAALWHDFHNQWADVPCTYSARPLCEMPAEAEGPVVVG